MSSLEIIARAIKPDLTIFTNVVFNVLQRIYGLYNLPKDMLVGIEHSFVIFDCQISLVGIDAGLFRKIVLIHMKVIGLLFKVSIFRPNTYAVCYLALSIAIKPGGHSSCFYVFSGNAIFLVKEIQPDVLMATEKELSMKLFTAPIKKIYLSSSSE